MYVFICVCVCVTCIYLITPCCPTLILFSTSLSSMWGFLCCFCGMRQWVSHRSIDKNLYVGAWIPLLNGNTSKEKLLQPLNYLLIFRDPVSLFPLHDKRLVCPFSCGSVRVVVGAENSMVWWRGRPRRRCRNTPPHPSSCSLVCDTLNFAMGDLMTLSISSYCCPLQKEASLPKPAWHRH